MIEAKELRIGNLVDALDCTGNKHVKKVTEIRELDHCGSKKTVQVVKAGIWPKCEPIPLTEEWLVRFGFIHRDNFYADQPNISVYKKDENDFYFQKAYLDDDDFSSIIFCAALPNTLLVPRVATVHQLQNLYYALTGEELNIKEL